MNALHIVVNASGADRKLLLATAHALIEKARADGVYVIAARVGGDDDLRRGDDCEVLELRGENLSSRDLAPSYLEVVKDLVEALTISGARVWGASVFAVDTEYSVFDERPDLQPRDDKAPAPKPVSVQISDANGERDKAVGELAQAKRDLEVFKKAFETEKHAKQVALEALERATIEVQALSSYRDKVNPLPPAAPPRLV